MNEKTPSIEDVVKFAEILGVTLTPGQRRIAAAALSRPPHRPFFLPHRRDRQVDEMIEALVATYERVHRPSSTIAPTST